MHSLNGCLQTFCTLNWNYTFNNEVPVHSTSITLKGFAILTTSLSSLCCIALMFHEKILKIPKGIIRNRKSKDIQQMTDIKRINGQTTIYKTLHRKLKIEQHESY